MADTIVYQLGVGVAGQQTMIPLKVHDNSDGTFSPVTNGASETALVAFNGERLTVGAAAVGPTAAVFAPSGEVAAEAVDASVETADIRILFDGRIPTASVGHLIVAGSSFRIEGAQNVAQLKMIRAAGVSAAVELSYERPA